MTDLPKKLGKRPRTDLSENLGENASFDRGVLVKATAGLLEDNDIDIVPLTLSQATNKALGLLLTEKSNHLKDSNRWDCKIKNILLRYNVARMQNSPDEISSLSQEMKIVFDELFETLSNEHFSNDEDIGCTCLMMLCHDIASDCFPFPRFISFANMRWVGEMGVDYKQKIALIESLIALVIKLKSVGMNFQEEEKVWFGKLFSVGLSTIKNDIDDENFKERIIELMRYLSNILEISDPAVEEESAKWTRKKDAKAASEAEIKEVGKKSRENPEGIERDYRHEESFYPKFDRTRRIRFNFQYGRIEELIQELEEFAIELEAEADEIAKSLDLRAKSVNIETSRELANSCVKAYFLCKAYYEVVDGLLNDKESICKLNFDRNNSEINFGNGRKIDYVNIYSYQSSPNENSRRCLRKILDLDFHSGDILQALNILDELGEVDLERKLLAQALAQEAFLNHDLPEALRLAIRFGDPRIIQKIIFKLAEKLNDVNSPHSEIFAILDLVRIAKESELGDLEKPTVHKILTNFVQFFITRPTQVHQLALLLSNGSISAYGVEETALLQELINNNLSGLALELLSTMVLQNVRLTEVSVINIAEQINLEVGKLLEADTPMQKLLESTPVCEIDINHMLQKLGMSHLLEDKK